MKNLLILCVTITLVTACQPKDTKSETEITETSPINVESNNQPVKEVVLKACTKEAKVCPDGNSVGRDPKNNCEFYACNTATKKKSSVMCPADVKECPDGSFVGRNHKNNCRFKDCPGSEK